MKGREEETAPILPCRREEKKNKKKRREKKKEAGDTTIPSFTGREILREKGGEGSFLSMNGGGEERGMTILSSAPLPAGKGGGSQRWKEKRDNDELPQKIQIGR